MISPKSVLLFFSGCGAGVLLSAILLSPAVKAHAGSLTAGPFVDVPAGHVAAGAVAEMKAKGILAGYPNNTYQGTKPVTRYELAVALARFAKFYDTSKTPLASVTVTIPHAPAWAAPSRKFLAANYYIPAKAPLFANPGAKIVSSDDLSEDLASVVNRISDRSLPPTSN